MCTLFDFEKKNSPSPFCGARVYLSGKFSMEKKEIVALLDGNGAVLRSEQSNALLGLSKETCVIIVGENRLVNDLVEAERLSFNGYNIPTISEAEMRTILSGDKEANFPKPIKNVDINYDFLFTSRFSPIVHLNFHELTHPLGKKDIFLYEVKGESHLLRTCLGNIGAYTSNDFDPNSTDYCWLRKETIEKLKRNEKDNFIQIITDKYNTSNSSQFNYKFIIEQEVVFWLENRAREIGDAISLDCITRYKDSAYSVPDLAHTSLRFC